MLQHGFITDERPESIAQFLLHTEGLSKAQIGEYLGDGCVTFKLHLDLLADPYMLLLLVIPVISQSCMPSST
jgi:hypothetical protein